MSEQEKVAEQSTAKVSRRNVLKAAMAAGGAAVLGFPMIAKGQTGPIQMRFQSTWPSKDIFHEYA
ncbi:MAG: twin-arginine translocation signal domain-containing protein, partial [Candidatus Binatia bacterium]